MNRPGSLFLVSIALATVSSTCDSARGGNVPLRLIVGVDTSGRPQNKPQDWPDQAGPWNGKGARYNAGNQKLVFETFREDIIGGSRTGGVTAPGVESYYVAGADTGTIHSAGTTVLYVAKKDGSAARCIGCEDVQDGRDGAEVYLAEPKASGSATMPLRQRGATVFANQNKDLAAWHPNGEWIIAGVEMKRHALTHDLGNSEVGMFNNLWAISDDGKTWVQLTHYEETWHCYDRVAMTPYAAIDKKNCPDSARYASAEYEHPYAAYSGSARNQPPPASATMRPTVGNRERDGRVLVVWGERVGLDPKYSWGGALQLAMAEIVINNGLPTLINYRRNITPTPAHPDGENLWSNPGGNTVIGAGYEPWMFSKDDSEILFASDVFLSQSLQPRRRPVVRKRSTQWPGDRKTEPWTEAFVDVVAWTWKPPALLQNITAYDRRLYDYQQNAAPPPTRYFGHWEEPAVYSLSQDALEYVVFASSANLVPPWNPLRHGETFGLDVWITPRDRSTPVRRLTFFNQPHEKRYWAYPTTVDPEDQTFFLTVVPGQRERPNPPGAIYTLAAPYAD